MDNFGRNYQRTASTIMVIDLKCEMYICRETLTKTDLIKKENGTEYFQHCI